MKSLSRKHNLSLKLFGIQIINQIVSKAHTAIYVEYREKTVYEIIQENLKAYYS